MLDTKKIISGGWIHDQAAFLYLCMNLHCAIFEFSEKLELLASSFNLNIYLTANKITKNNYSRINYKIIM
jgi:hypothetical protein